jgi:hypothetical protein
VNRRRIIGASLGLLAMLFGTALIAKSFGAIQPPDPAGELLEQSYTLSNRMSPAERPYYLVNLIMSSKGIASNERIEYWCKEMFQAAFEVQDGWDRVVLEKNALVFLSAVKPVAAMQLFSKIENPQPDSDGTFPEDVRADSALPIFSNYWKDAKDTPEKLGRLPEIKAQAKRLGETGEYPYAAMSFIIGELDKLSTEESKKESTEIFVEALDFYQNGSAKYVNRNRQFLVFLLDIRKKKAIPDLDLFTQALHVFSVKLMQSPKDMDFAGEFRNSKGVAIPVTDDRVKSLLEAIPMIREYSPELVTQLTREYPELAKADENMPFFSAGYVSPDIQRSQAALLHSRMFQRSLIKEIEKVQQDDPETAKLLAAKLSDDGIHIEGYSALLPGLMKLNPVEAKQIYYGELTRLQEVREGVGHLSALSSLAKGAYHVEGDYRFADLATAAVDEGTALFDEDSRQRPQLPPYLRKGYAQLASLAEFGARHGSDALLNRVQQIQDLGLKVDLLVYEAKGIKESQQHKAF